MFFINLGGGDEARRWPAPQAAILPILSAQTHSGIPYRTTQQGADAPTTSPAYGADMGK